MNNRYWQTITCTHCGVAQAAPSRNVIQRRFLASAGQYHHVRDERLCVECQTPLPGPHNVTTVDPNQDRNNASPPLDRNTENNPMGPLPVQKQSSRLMSQNHDNNQGPSDAKKINSRFRYFELLEWAIQQRKREIANSTDKTQKEVLTTAIESTKEISAYYWARNAAKNRQLSYDHWSRRLAYLMYSTACNAYFTEYVLSNDSLLNRYLHQAAERSKALNICTFGGGPGSELLGVANWIIEHNFNTKISIEPTRTDQSHSWDQDWEALRDGIHYWLKQRFGASPTSWPIGISTSSMHELDLRTPESLNKISNAISIKQDLFIFSYALSELHHTNQLERAKNIFSELKIRANDNAKILIIDRHQPELVNRLRFFADAGGMRVLSEMTDNRQRIRMPREDSAESLGNVYHQLQAIDQSPRLTGDIFWMVVG